MKRVLIARGLLVLCVFFGIWVYMLWPFIQNPALLDEELVTSLVLSRALDLYKHIWIFVLIDLVLLFWLWRWWKRRRTRNV
jgi:hypothetical protein